MIERIGGWPRAVPFLLMSVILGATSAAGSARAAETYPPQIAKMVEDDVKGCPEGRKAGRIQAGYLVAADFNGDGIADYVVDNGKSNCFDVSLMCGSAGCPIMAMISSGTTFREVEIGHVQGYDIVQQDGRAALRLGVHGSSCDRPGATACSRLMTWNGTEFVSGKARLGNAAAAPAAAPKLRGAQPDNVRPYGEWVALQGDGKCPDGGQGIVIEPSRIIVSYGGDRTTFKPVRLDGCTGAVCAFSGAGGKWSVTRRGPDRIVFEGPHNRKVSDRSEAQRNRSSPGCSMVNVYP